MRGDKQDERGTLLLLGLWVLFVFVFFSVSGSSLPAYILPIFPALALLGGAWLAAGERHVALAAQAAVGVLAGAAMSLAGFLRPDDGLWLIASGVVLAAASVAAAALARRQYAGRAIAALAIGGFAATQIGIAGHAGTFAGRFSAQGTVESLLRDIGPQAQIFAVDGYDHSIPWALRRTVTMVIHRDELEMGITAEPDKFVPDLKQFARAWEAAGEAYALFPAEGFSERALPEVRMEMVGQGPRYVVVRKPALR